MPSSRAFSAAFQQPQPASGNKFSLFLSPATPTTNQRNMPCFKVVTNLEKPSAEAVSTLLTQASALVAKLLSKPEQYVQVVLQFDVSMSFGGTTAPTANCELASIGGIDGDANVTHSKAIADLLKEHLGLESDRVYTNFVSLERENYGWSGKTFRK
eukprot:m.119795 g.119795  ORF g.119795 m.119795 type:complete len:156 (+) comp16482_c0_seq1:1143-1610(+)